MPDGAPSPSAVLPVRGSLMQGRRGIVMGVANDRSIAWGIAAACAAQGAELAFTYQGDALEKRVRPLAESVGSKLVVPCDVADDASGCSVRDAADGEQRERDEGDEGGACAHGGSSRGGWSIPVRPPTAAPVTAAR